jgi:hypothetical protein
MAARGEDEQIPRFGNGHLPQVRCRVEQSAFRGHVDRPPAYRDEVIVERLDRAIAQPVPGGAGHRPRREVVQVRALGRAGQLGGDVAHGPMMA